ncbi:helicase-related protein [Streptomyces alboniger]|uniref:Helicase n=1 Tax=Streptomyces alboniger TaxID=132473 RepID=A0A5J6HIT2_STRAD|nr:helicase-related protein [Streptomyces alboniger]QEV18281.1 helicase [Streptomyces alboniger]
MTTTEEELADHRDAFVAYLRQQLVGPAGGEDETLVDPPDRRYLMGTLYPRGTDLHIHTSAAGEEEDPEGAIGPGEEDGFADDPVAEANAWLPSSMGFSFFTDAPRIDLVCSAARYETSREGRRRVWKRRPRQTEAISVTAESAGGASVLDGHAKLFTRWRRHRNGHLVTCVLANAHHEDEEPRDAWNLMLFQAELTAGTVGGEVLEYPSTRLNSRDPEEQELRIQYRHVVTRAIGHGCAVEWDDTSKPVTSLSAEVLPQKTVPHIRPDGPADLPILKLAGLSRADLSAEDLRAGLTSFVADYRAWYENLDIERSKLHDWAKPPAARILDRILTAVERMESGVQALTSDTPAGEDAREAFRLANRAMALQMLHSRRELAGTRRRRNEDVVHVSEPDGDAAWHPFQLAFFLLVVEGLMNPNSDDRDTVDLIWFPTGGGKTEAYLLTACFEIAWRRLHHGAAGGGTAVISRYTLSLLTTQQFQRTATAICALEYMRRGHDGDEGRRLGSEPITVGLWVGQETTPNSYARATVELGELKQLTEPDDRFLLERCPWCGTEIVPRRYTRDSDYGISADHSSFSFNCPRETCVFHDQLPVAVVDQHIYEYPPTFLLGTVDKFARLAWEPKAGRIFGGRGRLRPSLVIQDELHLLAGPLGTTVGLYESAVLALCGWEGARPKVIASTATIRRSQEQIQNLYGRSTQLFPPAGLDARNSFFASTDGTRPGRLYVGVMAQGHTPATATVHTGAATLQASESVTDRDDLRDAYWTVVAYHNSLRELGRTITIARDDIPARLAHLTRDEAFRRDLPDSTVVELTSNISRTAQPKLLDRLGRSLTDKESVSFLATTNMLSVGVDVPRLGLMIMNGQPKTTSEYIQATSRVGRRLVPGLIVTLFRSSKPRDRSHYESFGPYHASLYRHVEPTSVTPWSPPSRQRALHAVLTILVRHGLGLASEDMAGDVVGRREDLEMIRDRLLSHIRISDPSEAGAAEDDLNARIDEWLQAAESARGNGGRLYYKPQGRGDDALLTDFGKPAEGLWETAQSMRNVDRDCLVAVRGA